MTHTEPTYDLPHQIKLEFCQIEAPPDEDTRRIEIGVRGVITSGDGLVAGVNFDADRCIAKRGSGAVSRTGRAIH